jgi:Asp/Glu/hydantoin racemase
MTIRIWHQSFTDLELLPSYAGMLREHAARVCAPGTSVDVHGVRPGSYPEGMNPIEATRYAWCNHVLASQIAWNAQRAEREGYDAVAISCFFDPGLREARSLVDIPVVSMCETALLLGTSVGGRFGLLGLQGEQSFALRELARSYGATDRVVATLPIEPAITEEELEGVYDGGGDLEERLERVAAQAVAAGADLLVPAEGVLNTSLVRRGISTLAGVPVLDAYGLLLGYAEMLVRLRRATGLTTSHAGAYGRPPGDTGDHLALATAASLVEGARGSVVGVPG